MPTPTLPLPFVRGIEKPARHGGSGDTSMQMRIWPCIAMLWLVIAGSLFRRLRTVRHLLPEQVVAQLAHALRGGIEPVRLADEAPSLRVSQPMSPSVLVSRRGALFPRFL